ncbi:MAG: sigma-70 family RNA polymerase sigma factor [Myxococcales bacterium]|nr:sigma-70 family RNA polymerase sigma factor [Myxococcales bacterium]
MAFPIKPPRPPLDEAAIAELYRRCGALVLRRCRLLLRDPAEAEDALQEVFMRLLRYGASLEGERVPLSWLYRTAERCCFDRLRRRRREEPVDEAALAREPTPIDEALGSEAREVLGRFFHRLPDKLKRLALLHYLDGLPQERIAVELGWSRRTVGKKLRALAERAVRWKSGART